LKIKKLNVVLIKNNTMDLIQEAKNRGYRKGTPIRYVPHAIDYVEGDYFEVEDGELKAYAKPIEERKGFDDFKHDTLFDGENWVEIVDLSSRTEGQKLIDKQNDIY
jgi:hypothetical protein